MNEYRMTRPTLYPKSSFGEKDLSCRQGYYIVAKDDADAHRQMRQMFPNDAYFDIQLWETGVEPWFTEEEVA